MIRAWNFLLLAIVFEVAGTSSMNFAGKYGSVWGFVIMYLFIAISYFFLSKAVKRIAIGVAYATSEGLGIALIAVVSFFIFGDELSWVQVSGIALAIIGIILITIGEVHADTENNE